MRDFDGVDDEGEKLSGSGSDSRLIDKIRKLTLTTAGEMLRFLVALLGVTGRGRYHRAKRRTSPFSPRKPITTEVLLLQEAIPGRPLDICLAYGGNDVPRFILT